MSSIALGMCRCPYCRRGTLVLDPVSRPVWKVACNRCDRLIKFAHGANKVTLSKEKCGTCKARHVVVDYPKNASPAPDGQTHKEGCLACDVFLNGTTEVVLGKLTKSRGGGRRKGGRRKKGRRKGGASRVERETYSLNAGAGKTGRMRFKA